jgi:hypothetical protein
MNPLLSLDLGWFGWNVSLNGMPPIGGPGAAAGFPLPHPGKLDHGHGMSKRAEQRGR